MKAWCREQSGRPLLVPRKHPQTHSCRSVHSRSCANKFIPAQKMIIWCCCAGRDKTQSSSQSTEAGFRGGDKRPFITESATRCSPYDRLQSSGQGQTTTQGGAYVQRHWCWHLYCCTRSTETVQHLSCFRPLPRWTPKVTHVRQIDHRFPLDDLDLSGQIRSWSEWSRSCCQVEAT